LRVKDGDDGGLLLGMATLVAAVAALSRAFIGDEDMELCI